MTAPDDEPPTRTDPGRDELAADALTAPDPGRSRPDDEPVTTLDPDRTPPVSGWSRILPARLDERFQIVRDLTGSGQQGDVYLVLVRDSGEQRVLKVHRPGSRPDQRVLDFLARQPNRCVVTVYETGAEEGRQYEVMEYLAGGNLFEWRRRQPSGVDRAVVAGLVRQLADGLAGLHSAGVVHRDIKPGNVLIRTLEPLEVVIADLGISTHVTGGEAFTWSNTVGTVPYMPPEFVSGGQIVPAFDWWSLGVTVYELATGRGLFAGVDHERAVRSWIATRPVELDAVTDDRIRLLCRGLLAMAPENRWGAGQVDLWLQGGSPPVAADPLPQRTTTSADEPYVYLGQEYRERDMLAAAMTTNWNFSRTLLFDGDRGPRRQLAEWLTQFPEPGVPVGRPDRRASDDVRLLYQLRAVDPTYPPCYRGWNITRSHLPELASEGVQGTGGAADIVAELWRADLLPLLATGSASQNLGGGDGLPEALYRWRGEVDNLRLLARSLPDAGARTEMSRVLRDEQPYALSLSLLAATATPAHRLEVRRVLDDRRQALNLPWFSDLVDRREFEWIAYALVPYATRQANRRDLEERARQAREAWLRRTERQREWSRRQNRPQALGYAVTGVAAVAVFLFALIGFSNAMGVATRSQIDDGWLAAVIALTVTTVTESLLAWDTGGRFHPAYSFLGAGSIALGRASRNLIARRIAVPVVLVILAVLGTLTVYRPVVPPFVLAAGTVVWAVRRHLAWREQDRRERAIVRAA
ncbi:serine/threonine-protein kinase [Actinocrispum wychmicini]|uniref:non-specific serine/threonine protein kinase n=1 Tax=Actinocrispum wychmicini TaxID=1213861 RepID=A0A4R2J4Y9_9PSEU|nr:serine/threonine-protein kinase [Actinocrispum wychmicini]TCO52917.1 serine/threonine protein kinase [Actinocrispum wychmicini]